VKAATPTELSDAGANSSPSGPAWTAGINPPGSGSSNAPGTGATLAGAIGAGAAAASWPGVRGPCRSRIETVESKRKAITPADTTMSGTVLPAG
jgi:hypothetical protein